ncbi:MAG: methyltransferase domain-containing protein [Planctomycetota bacterium]|nr:MAG: methyltransferase domain-containing protein [Planctomycetota bacterium]
METRAEALDFPRRDLRLGVCPDCGFLFNTILDASVQAYSEKYEETQGFSPTFNRFARELVDTLIERHNLRGKRILEIGCGKGEFLIELCARGENDGIGIDPSYRPDRTTHPAAGRIEFIRDLYSERYTHLTADFVCCRHTLEHIGPTLEFMRMVRRAIGDRPETVVFFELPEALRVLREGAFWDIYYEHCSYFTPGALARLFRLADFDPTRIELVYDSQYLLITALPRTPSDAKLPHEESPAEVIREVDAFRTRCAESIAKWAQFVRGAFAKGERVVLWGSGSKGVSFLTTLGISDEIEYVVDINPHKHGRFMPGAGQEIVPPDFLRDYQPSHVIAMNPVYRDEIQAELDRLGVAAQLAAL